MTNKIKAFTKYYSNREDGKPTHKAIFSRLSSLGGGAYKSNIYLKSNLIVNFGIILSPDNAGGSSSMTIEAFQKFITEANYREIEICEDIEKTFRHPKAELEQAFEDYENKQNMKIHNNVEELFESLEEVPPEEAKYICSNCGDKLGAVGCTSDFKLGIFCSAWCPNTTIKEEPKSIWKSIDELDQFIIPNAQDEQDCLVFFNDGTINMALYSPYEKEFYYDSICKFEIDREYIKEFCTLTDFIEDHKNLKDHIESLEERIKKLEEK